MGTSAPPLPVEVADEEELVPAWVHMDLERGTSYPQACHQRGEAASSLEEMANVWVDAADVVPTGRETTWAEGGWGRGAITGLPETTLEGTTMAPDGTVTRVAADGEEAGQVGPITGTKKQACWVAAATRDAPFGPAS